MKLNWKDKQYHITLFRLRFGGRKGNQMGLKNLIEGFVLRVALKKGVKAAVAFIISATASAKVAPLLAQLGITLDPSQLEMGLTAIGTGGLVAFLNYLKQKTSLGQKYL